MPHRHRQQPAPPPAAGPTAPSATPCPKPAEPPPGPGDGLRPAPCDRWLGALLAALVLGVFAPALRHDFITYDDPAYVVANPHVNTGLSWANFRWAWTSFEHSNWHPLTWLSHQLDCTLFGLAPWGHHLTNILLHAASTLLLFVVLRRATGFRWRSLVVAALFGLHPLRVESVAWIAERKDVLSTCLGLFALRAYVLYAERRRTAAAGAGRGYAWALVAFAASLTAKPMLVTLPCVLLLLDVWPLDRLASPAPRPWLRLLAEKLPFFALAAASCVLTTHAQAAGGAVKSLEDYTLVGRLANALLAYSQYLGKLFWPVDLAVLYPNFGEQPPAASLAFAALLLAAITAAALLLWRRGHRWAVVGWLWFLGTLVPVIGLVQVGGQTMADRYSYFPSIGVLLVLVWATAEATARRPRRALLLGTAAGAALAACVAVTSVQLGRWRDSVTLFRHTVAVTQDNWMAHFNLHVAYSRIPGCAREAREEFARMAAIIAAFAERYNQRGLALLREPARRPEAIAAFQKAVRIKGDEPAPHLNLGRALAQAGRTDEALAELRLATRLDPENGDARLALGRLLAEQPGQREAALAELRLAVWLLSGSVEAHTALAGVCAADPRRRAEATAEYEKALRLDPRNAEAAAGLARLRAP